MTFDDKSRYDRIFQQVTHKGGESAIKYIKRFQNAHALSVLVGNIHSESQLNSAHFLVEGMVNKTDQQKRS